MSYIFMYGSQSTVGLTPANSGEAMYHFKELAKQAGWVVQAWGDGVSGFSNSPSDGITSAAMMAVTGAWFVIKQPTYADAAGAPGGRQFVFRNCFGAGNGYWLNVYIPLDNSNAPQTMTTPGTATNVPRYAIESVIRGTPPTTGGFWFNATNGSYRVNIGANNAAPYQLFMFNWANLSSPPDLATAGGSFVFDTLVSGSFPAEDIDPVVVYAPQPAQSNFNYAGLGSESSTTTTAPRAWFRKSMTGGAFGYAPAMLMTNAALTRLYPGSMGHSATTGKDDGVPIMFGRRSGQLSVTWYPSGMKGMAQMLRWVSTNARTSSLLTNSTAGDRIVVDSVILPWDGSVPVV